MNGEQQADGMQGQNDTLKPWYKKWWGVLLAICIWPLFAIWYITKKTAWSNQKKGAAILVVVVLAIYIYGSDKPSEEKPQAKQEVPQTEQQENRAQELVVQTKEEVQPPAPQFAYDVPALIGKSLSEVEVILGKPTTAKEPTKQQLEIVDTWEVDYEKDGVGLLVSYNPKTKAVVEFFMDGEDEAKLLTQGNLQAKSDSYVVSPVKNILDSSKITGIKIAKKLPQELDASVTFSALELKVENNEDYRWTNCKFEINGKLFSGGYEYKLSGGVKPNGSVTVPFSEFAQDGKRFNFFTEKPEKLSISCDALEQHRFNVFGVN